MFGRADEELSRFWAYNDNWITAVISVVLAIAAAQAVDRWLDHRGRRFAEAVVRGELTQEADTRLRFIRRLVSAAIILIGVSVALSQFTGLSRLATSLLASGAIAAAVLGFAARQTLANVIAGMMLAVSQPLRVGDWVTFEEAYGVVEDVRLNYTVLRTPGDQRVIIPNERLATGILRNDTINSAAVGLDVAVWLPPETDAERAIAALADETGADVSVAEHVPWGTRLAIGGDPVAPEQRAGREAELRRQALARLRAEGLLPVGARVQAAGTPAARANEH
jgi:small-conductance mechanosensitive channel